MARFPLPTALLTRFPLQTASLLSASKYVPAATQNVILLKIFMPSLGKHLLLLFIFFLLCALVFFPAFMSENLMYLGVYTEVGQKRTLVPLELES